MHSWNYRFLWTKNFHFVLFNKFKMKKSNLSSSSLSDLSRLNFPLYVSPKFSSKKGRCSKDSGNISIICIDGQLNSKNTSFTFLARLTISFIESSWSFCIKKWTKKCKSSLCNLMLIWFIEFQARYFEPAALKGDATKPARHSFYSNVVPVIGEKEENALLKKLN